MKTITNTSALLITAILFLAAANTVFAGDDDKVKTHVTYLPSRMTVGSSVEITVTLTNIGDNTWSSDNLSAKVTGPFAFISNGSSSFILEPGQSQTINYKLTAPDKNGMNKCEIFFYSSDKKIGYIYKIITVNL